MEPGQLSETRRRADAKSVILFLHGFSGDSDETWGLFPLLIKAEDSLREWDILSLGYHSSFLPGTRGLWSADPDLPILAQLLRTELTITPLLNYTEIALIAHSMGGLMAQRAIVDESDLTRRVRRLFLFGTPSGGLKKASFLSGLLGRLAGEQVHNMASDSDFVKDLRSRWTSTYPAGPNFQFFTIAGDKDQFVTPDSSLKPFAVKYQKVVTGNHLDIVKPKNASKDAVRLMISALTGAPEPEAAKSDLRLAAEVGSAAPAGMAIAEAAAAGRVQFETEAEVVDAALALDRNNQRAEAIALLKRYQNLGPDAKGTLAGRIKRRWLQQGEQGDAYWALGLYRDALNVVRAGPETEYNIGQVFYHAINVAFMQYVAFDRLAEAQEMARLALEYARKSAAPDVWSVATQAEAMLYLQAPADALQLYRDAVGMNAEKWKLKSAGEQAQQVAAKLRNEDLQRKLTDIFDRRAASAQP